MAYRWTYMESIIVAHAVLGGLLGMIIWPVIAVSGRYLRTYYPKWVNLHAALAWGISAPVAVVVFALGRYHKEGDDDNWTTLHFRLGLVLLLLGLLQPIYGTVLHSLGSKVPIMGTKSVLRYGHPVVGITILVLGFIQVKSGYGQWGEPGESVPYGFTIAWAVLVAFWGAIYVGGFALFPHQIN